MTESILFSIVAINVLFALIALFMALCKRFFSRRTANLQYRLWKIIFICIPISFAILPVKPMLLSAWSAPPLFAVTITRQENPLPLNLAQQSDTDGAQAPQSQTNGVAVHLSEHVKATMKASVFLYFAGALLFAVGAAAHHRRVLGRICRYNRAASDSQLECRDRLCDALRIRRAPQVYPNPSIVSPLLTVLTEPMILIPTKDYSEEQLYYILKHELVHFAHRDFFWKAVALLNLCLLWCNPLAYFANRSMDRAAELSCDEAVIDQASRKDKKAYAAMLLDFLEQEAAQNKHTYLQLSIQGGFGEMQNRIQKLITSVPCKKSRASQAAVYAAILLLLGVGNSFFVYAAPEAIQSAVVSAVEAAPPTEAQAVAARLEPPVSDTDTTQYVSPVSGYTFSTDEDHGSSLVYYVPVGTPVFAAAAGVVADIKKIGEGEDRWFMGTCVVVENAQGERFYYGHLKEALVEVGDAVDAGGTVGSSGHTGNAVVSGQLTVYVLDKNGDDVTAAIKQRLQ